MAGATISPVPLEVLIPALLKSQQTTPHTASNGPRPPVELGSIQTIDRRMKSWMSKLRAMALIPIPLSYRLMIFVQTHNIGVTFSTLRLIRCMI